VHAERTAYLQAVNSASEVDENTLRRLLLRRAMTDIRRLWKLQADRESIYSLMRSGALEESVWQSYKAAETGIQREIYEVQAEAETFKEGWSESILKEAVVLCQREDTLSTLLKEKEKEEKKKSKTILAPSKPTPSPIDSSVVSSSKSSVKVTEEKDDNS
jgi:translocation protein SEC66